MRRSAVRTLAAGIVGACLGFAAPHFGIAVGHAAAIGASDGARGSARPIADDDDKSKCSCPSVVCTTDDGMRNAIAPCVARCHEDETPSCTCGKCNSDGHPDKYSQCRCKEKE